MASEQGNARLGSTSALLAPEQPPDGRRVDHAGNRPCCLDEGDVDREFAVAGDELLGAVERIDEEEPPRRPGNGAARHRLLGNHRNLRREPSKSGQDDLLRRDVRRGHWRGIGLERHLRPAIVESEDDLSGLPGQRDQAGKEGTGGRDLRHALFRELQSLGNFHPGSPRVTSPPRQPSSAIREPSPR
jgi:hypothetical protein